MQIAPVTPSQQNEIGSFTRSHNVVVIAGTDGMGNGFEDLWRRGAVGKQVYDRKATKLPLLREANATTQGGVILAVVGPAGIQHDQGDLPALSRPLSLQPIPILTGGIELSGSLNSDGGTQNRRWYGLIAALLSI